MELLFEDDQVAFHHFVPNAHSNTSPALPGLRGEKPSASGMSGMTLEGSPNEARSQPMPPSGIASHPQPNNPAIKQGVQLPLSEMPPIAITVHSPGESSASISLEDTAKEAAVSSTASDAAHIHFLYADDQVFS